MIEQGDPYATRTEVKTPDGGVALEFHYLDANDAPCSPELAVKAEFTRLAADGSILERGWLHADADA